MMPLYFPEDKTEYIPAAISCILFITGAFFTWRIFVKASKREMKKFDEMEKNLHKINGTYQKSDS
ncbi:hypothetical protein [Ectobacillus panaciterrae]|uniref:hypothetical protein n=1 Tax=Ectobacillus panaciterrae TaxID=363872 RepID=UPI00040EDAD5|nr:hypothetical protein [Ectobacillus panaciterrae]